MFNTIFDSGIFPECWSKGYIVPLHKKGDTNQTTNYRGITLMSNLGKLFSSILTSRVESWFESNNFISDSQFGFRKKCGTTDAIFVLSNLVEHILNCNLRIPCAFIDLKRAFDSVNREALWYKLFNMGLRGKVLNIFCSMYASVKSCVKHCNTFSDFFDVSVGVIQGQTSSPALFALFLEDLELYLQDSNSCGLTLIETCFIILLFADDMVILGNSKEDLQHSLDLLYAYCSKWGLEVNISKTKIIVFRKRGRVKGNEKWYYNHNEIEVVDNFNYLGVVLNYTGSFLLNNQYAVGKALKAMHVLYSNISKHFVNPKISLELFDAFVNPIINFGCQIWGFTKSKELERIHLKFCKMVLGVKQSTCNAAVYGELGRYRLYINRYVLMIKYFFKVIKSENILIKTIYKTMLNDMSFGKANWLSRVKSLLEENGFLYIWENPERVNLDHFVGIFKQRLKDSFLQKWYSDLSTSTVLSPLYRHLKDEFEMASYLSIILTKSLRICLTKIRTSSHILRVESGRHGRIRIPRNERFCIYCDMNCIEDEYHFIIECPFYYSLRKKYIEKKYYVRPSMFKFISLMKSVEYNTIQKVCTFIKFAFNKRNANQN